MKKEALLGEIGELIRSAPPADKFQDHSPEVLSWSGRVAAILDRWGAGRALAARMHIDRLQSPYTTTSLSGERAGLLTILYEAEYNLRLDTVGPVNVAIGSGGVYS